MAIHRKGATKGVVLAAFLRISIFSGRREVWPSGCFMMIAEASKSKFGDTTVAMEKKVLEGKKTGPVAKGNTTSKVGTVKLAPKVVTALKVGNW